MENTISTDLTKVNIPAKFNLSDSAIAQLREQYLPLVIAGLDDKKGYQLVREARLTIKGKRVEVEKTRKELKEESLAYGRAVDAEAKRISAALEPIEDHLTKQEKAIDDEKERIRAEKERERERQRAALLQARVDQLTPLGAPIDLIALAVMNDQEFDTALLAATVAHEREQERLAHVEAERQTAQRQRLAEEKQKLAEEDRRQREELAEIERRAREKLAAIKAEEDASRQAIAKEEQRLAAEKAEQEAYQKALNEERRQLEETRRRLAEKYEEAMKESQQSAPDGALTEEPREILVTESETVEMAPLLRPTLMQRKLIEDCHYFLSDEWDGQDPVYYLKDLSRTVLVVMDELKIEVAENDA
jgi:septal ring factor EnvC (AmiA/AmiB activator)